MNKLWRIWAKSLGEKAGKNDTEADNIARIRTFIFITYLATNLFIIAEGEDAMLVGQPLDITKIVFATLAGVL